MSTGENIRLIARASLVKCNFYLAKGVFMIGLRPSLSVHLLTIDLNDNSWSNFEIISHKLSLGGPLPKWF